MAEPSQFFPGGGDDLSVPMMDDLSPPLDISTAPDDQSPNDDLLQTD
jgi:hypothetical protein